MNENATKKTERPLKKLIAVWVIFALILVPFANYVGDKNGARAEEAFSETVVSNTDNGTYIQETVKLDIATDSDATNKTVIKESDQKSVHILLSKAQGLQVTPSPENVMPDDFAGVSLGYIEVADDTVEKTLGADNAAIKPFTSTDIIKKTSFTAPTKYAVYAKDDADNGDSAYKLQYVLQIDVADTAFADGTGIYYKGKTVSGENVYVKNTDVQFRAAKKSDVEASEIRYFVTDKSQTEAGLLNALNYKTSVDYSSYKGKVVYVYAGLVSSQKGNRVLAYKPLGCVYMSNDTQKPAVDCLSVTESLKADDDYSEIEENHKDANGVYYGNKEYYRYTLQVKDTAATGQDASGLKSVTAKLGATTVAADQIKKLANGNYEITISKEQAANGDTLTVTAVDNMDNSINYTCPVKIKQVTENTVVTGATLKTKDVLNGGATLAKETQKQNIVIKFDTTKTITKVEIENADGKKFTASDITSTKATVQRVITTTASISIPTSLDKTEKIYGMTVKAYDKNGALTLVDQTGTEKTYTLGNILYDAEAPSITAAYIQEQTESGEWKTVVDKALDTKESYVTERNKNYRYLITVTDKADGSGVNPNEVIAALPNKERRQLTKEGDNTYSLFVGNVDFTATVTVGDKAGNVSKEIVLRTIRQIDDNIYVEGKKITYTDKDGQIQNVTDAIANGTFKYTNKKLTLEVNVSSSCAIESAKLYSNSAAALTGKIDSSTNKTVDAENRYHATIRFTLPETTDNTAFSSMYLMITDTRAENTGKTIRYPGSGALGDVLYDNTRPELAISNTLEDVWYKPFELEYSIISGNDIVESPLASASYTIQDSTDNKNVDLVAKDSTSTYVDGKIKLANSTSTLGTLITFKAADKCQNIMAAQSYRIKVDGEAPKIESLTVNGMSKVTVPINGDVSIVTSIKDNLTIDTATIAVMDPNNNVDTTMLAKDMESAEYAGYNVKGSKNVTLSLEKLIGHTPEDGVYTIFVNAKDKAGNVAEQKKLSFRVDNTVPVVTAKIIGGETAGKQPGKNYDGTACDYFYRSDVAMLLTFDDENIKTSNVIVTDNGNAVSVKWNQIEGTDKWQASYVATQQGAHTIRISATDNAGNKAVDKQVSFICDKEVPQITAVVNGGIVYSESMGQLDLTSDSVISFSVNDANEDVNDFNYQLIKTSPDQLPVTADYIKTDNRAFGFSDEAEYELHVFSVDKAGNRSADRVVKFRLDKTAPQLEIGGAASGSSLDSGTTLTFTMTEAFWRDASGTVTITRKASDGAAEANYKTIDFTPTGRVTSLTESLSETGEYKVTFTGKDRAGHTAEAASYTVKIDTGKPVIALSGVKNNDKTTGQVEFLAQIDEDFYLTKSVTINATRKYLDAKTNTEKTEDIKFTGYNPTAATTVIRNTFTEDGVYDIQIECKDAAGNQDVQEVSFTIDKTKPVIDEKVLSAYTGKLTKFAWDYDLNDVVYDLTVCDVHMYLNGSEYDGTSEIEDGAYEMKITAEDELGNATDETINFNLDTKAPTFIVTGVEDGEIKNEQYDINVSLQLEEDTLDEVALNGSAVEIKDNAASISITEKGDYELTMKAHDEAGNVAEQTISFTYGEKNHVLLFVLIGVGVLVLAGGAAAIIIAGKKKKG